MIEDSDIIWLTENYPPQKGGMAQSCDRIVNGLRESGLVIHIIHFTNRKEAYKNELQENGTYAAVPIHHDESHTLHLTINFLAQRNFKNPLIVVFGGYLPMLAAPIYKAWLNSKLLLMIRGNDFDAAVFSPKKRQMLTDALQQADLITSVSQQKLLVISRLFPDIKITYIPNGIEPESWQPLPSDKLFAKNWQVAHANGKLVLGCFGHLKEKKGLDVLLSAMNSPALKDKYRLLMIGEVSEALQDDLNQMHVAYHCLPFVERLSLIKYYLCCQAIIIPSHYDGMPNVLLEAGLLGLPVIASGKDGMLDLITNGKDGLLFQAGDANDLRQVLFSFAQMKESQKNLMGQNLLQKIQNDFNNQLETERYIETIKSI